MKTEARLCPPPADGLTHLQAAEREGVLGHKLVVRRGVVVFDDEANQRQLWHVHVKLEVLVPGRVETSKKKKREKSRLHATKTTQKGAQPPNEAAGTKEGGTVVDNVMGLLLSAVGWNSQHLHFNQRVHDGGLLVVHFGELLR